MFSFVGWSFNHLTWESISTVLPALPQALRFWGLPSLAQSPHTQQGGSSLAFLKQCWGLALLSLPVPT